MATVVAVWYLVGKSYLLKWFVSVNTFWVFLEYASRVRKFIHKISIGLGIAIDTNGVVFTVPAFLRINSSQTRQLPCTWACVLGQ